ncbi:MAG: polyhydroxyalkanoic acid system family protein [Proteobacteria bacterium]|nr:polyhydroxyalkanoic acid system family protein [Pseudomonadota bacterium]MBQ9241856.1 polyhydroxyalkanoic acid system family protein [Pseudomonadota bacterium]
MAKIEREIKHCFGLEGGKKIIGALADKLQSNFKSLITSIDWNADKTAAVVKGKGFDGNFNLTDSSVKMVLNLGLATSLFKGKIEEEIDKHTTPEEIDKFAKSVNGDSDSAMA